MSFWLCNYYAYGNQLAGLSFTYDHMLDMADQVPCVVCRKNTAPKDRGFFLPIPYFTAEASTCFDSYNQPRLGGGRLFEHATLNCESAHLSQLAPCCPVAV